MSIRFECPHCQRVLTADDRRAGARAKCPGCGQVVVVPKPPANAPPAAPWPDDQPEIEPVRFHSRRAWREEMDMTSMVDVVFLLLIFFMVTASFKLQKSIESPPPDKKESSSQARTYQDIEQDDDYVIVRIDKDNTVWVNDSEAPSEQDLLVKLREARKGPPGSDTKGPTSLLVMADGDARHETVVMALDAGNAVGMENIRLATVDDGDF